MTAFSARSGVIPQTSIDDKNESGIAQCHWVLPNHRVKQIISQVGKSTFVRGPLIVTLWNSIPIAWRLIWYPNGHEASGGESGGAHFEQNRVNLLMYDCPKFVKSVVATVAFECSCVMSHWKISVTFTHKQISWGFADKLPTQHLISKEHRYIDLFHYIRIESITHTEESIGCIPNFVYKIQPHYPSSILSGHRHHSIHPHHPSILSSRLHRVVAQSNGDGSNPDKKKKNDNDDGQKKDGQNGVAINHPNGHPSVEDDRLLALREAELELELLRLKARREKMDSFMAVRAQQEYLENGLETGRRQRKKRRKIQKKKGDKKKKHHQIFNESDDSETGEDAPIAVAHDVANSQENQELLGHGGMASARLGGEMPEMNETDEDELKMDGIRVKRNDFAGLSVSEMVRDESVAVSDIARSAASHLKDDDSDDDDDASAAPPAQSGDEDADDDGDGLPDGSVERLNGPVLELASGDMIDGGMGGGGGGGGGGQKKRHDKKQMDLAKKLAIEMGDSAAQDEPVGEPNAPVIDPTISAMDDFAQTDEGHPN